VSQITRQNLILGIVFDAIDAFFTIPLIGEFSDVVWAPTAGYLMTVMYKGKIGKVGGNLYEIFPFTDFIPSFTLTWIYTYLVKRIKFIEVAVGFINLLCYWLVPNN
jgi:hypothetical protein